MDKASPEQQNKNKCSECGKILSSGRLLRAHRNAIHLKVRTHLCNYCGYNTTSQSNLRVHLRQHTKDKPFTCEECDYRTADHNSLRRHKMKHTGERPYKCPLCDYSSIQSSTYKVFMTFLYHIPSILTFFFQRLILEINMTVWLLNLSSRVNFAISALSAKSSSVCTRYQPIRQSLPKRETIKPWFDFSNLKKKVLIFKSNHFYLKEPQQWCFNSTM